MDFDPADLAALVELVAAAEGIKTASAEPADLSRLPGVWIRLDGIDYDRLGDGSTIAATVHVIVGEQDFTRALTQLAPLVDAVRGQLAAAGIPATDRAVPVAVTLPGSEAGCPAFALPVLVSTSPTPDDPDGDDADDTEE